MEGVIPKRPGAHLWEGGFCMGAATESAEIKGKALTQGQKEESCLPDVYSAQV